MEPLTFKILTDADDSGIQNINKGMSTLNTSSNKAGNALKSFSKDALEAKSGADLAAAGANALSQVLQKSLVGASVLGGAKILTDQIKQFAVIIKEVGQNTANALSALDKLGKINGLDSAIKSVDILDKALDSNIQKLGEIKSGNWFSRQIADATGVTDEIEKQNASLIRLRDANIALGFEAEAQNQKRLSGLTDEEKKYEAINIKLEKNKEIADKIANESLRDQAKANAEIIAQNERQVVQNETLLKLAEEKKSEEKNLVEVIKERASNELKAYEAEAKARQDAQKIFQTFEADKAKAHQEELKRSAERIYSIEEEIKALQERGDAIRESLAISGGDIATAASRVGGSARGPGQRKTSFEIGMERKAQQAEQEAQKKFQEEAEGIAKKRLEEKGQRTDKVAIQRELGVMQKEGITSKTLAPIEEYKDQKKALDENNKAISKNTEQLNESKKSQKELDAKAKESTATFNGTNYSVNQMGASSNMVADSLGSISSATENVINSFSDFSSSSKNSAQYVDGLGAAAEYANKWISDLATEASNLQIIFSKFGQMDIETINTNSIVLG